MECHWCYNQAEYRLILHPNTVVLLCDSCLVEACELPIVVEGDDIEKIKRKSIL